MRRARPRSGRSSTRNLPRDSRARWPLRHGSSNWPRAIGNGTANEYRLHPGVALIPCEHAIRPPATANGPRLLHHTHASIGCQRAVNADRPTRRRCAQAGRSRCPFGSWTSTPDPRVPSRSLPPALCRPAHHAAANLSSLQILCVPRPRPSQCDEVGTRRSRDPAVRSGTRRPCQPRWWLARSRLVATLCRSSDAFVLRSCGSATASQKQKSRVSVVLPR